MTRFIVNGEQVSEAEFRQGGAERLLEMFAAQSPPQSVTDAEFFRGEKWGDKKAYRHPDSFHQKVARKHGVSTTGKVYMPQLARKGFTGDPLAWVSGRGDIVKRTLAIGDNCDGLVTCNGARDEPPPKPVRLAEHSVRRLVRQYRKEQRWARKPLNEVREMVIDKHGAPA